MTDGPKIKNDQDISLDTGLGVDPGVTGEISNGGYAFVPATIDGSPEVVDGEAFDLNPRPGSDKLAITGNEMGGREVTVTDVTRLGSRGEEVINEDQISVEHMPMYPNESPVQTSSPIKLDKKSVTEDDRLENRIREDERLEEEQRLEEQQEAAQHQVFGRRLRSVPAYQSPLDQAAASLVYGDQTATNRYETVDASEGGAE